MSVFAVSLRISNGRVGTLQARALIVNGGTLFSPCPHLFFRRGTRRPTAVRLQKEKPHSISSCSPQAEILQMALGRCGFCREFWSDPLVDPLLHETHFCVGHFDVKLAKFGFRGGSKRENDVDRSPTLKKWGPPLTGQPKKA